jgi:hypothetical protein
VLLDGLAGLFIAGVELEQPEVRNERGLVVEELIFLDVSLLPQEVDLEGRLARHSDGNLEQARNRIPFAAPRVAFPRSGEKMHELLEREVATALANTFRKPRPRLFGVRLTLKPAERRSDRLRVHVTHFRRPRPTEPISTGRRDYAA